MLKTATFLSTLLLLTQSALADELELCRSNEDIDKGIDCFTRIINDPKTPSATGSQAHVGRGFLHIMDDQAEEAISDFNSAVKKNPKDGDAYIARGMGYLELGKPDRALKDFNRGIQMVSDQSYPYEWRGEAYEFLQMFGKATADYEKAISLDAGNEDAKKALRRLSGRNQAPDLSDFFGSWKAMGTPCDEYGEQEGYEISKNALANYFGGPCTSVKMTVSKDKFVAQAFCPAGEEADDGREQVIVEIVLTGEETGLLTQKFNDDQRGKLTDRFHRCVVD